MKFILGLVIFALTAHAQTADEIRTITLGDSITKGVRSGVKADETFSALLEKSARQNGLRVVVRNAGIGGERTDQALKRLDRDVIAQRPQFVTIMYGTNDSWVDKGKTESRITAGVYEANLREIVQRLNAAHIQAVLMTEPMFGEANPKNGAGEEANVRIAGYMERCRAVAKELKVPLVDHFAHWGAVQKRKQKLQDWTTDGCHPNPRGHAEMAHRIVQVMLPLLPLQADKTKAWDAGTPFTVRLDTLTHGYDAQMCWVHPRAGALPTTPPSVVLTMQKLLLTGSDVFYALADTRTDNLKTWSPIVEHPDTLGRRNEADSVVVAACDFWPKWHARSGKLLGTGHTVRYLNNKVMPARSREASYAVYDEKTRQWSPWTTLAMPHEPKFFDSGAGCAQRVDLPNGDILLPVYFKEKAEKYDRVTVLRCSFDGTTLKYLEQGNELAVNDGRGLAEPSLARFHNRFYLTLRNDLTGYVSTSEDGLHYTEPKLWTWDDGTELGSYNTQQHWVTHSDALYLVYTRKGASNDHVFRNRAPLFIAQIDPEKLCVLRATERIIVPERGARLGNFGIVDVSADESWVTVSEWMQTFSPPLIIPVSNPYGADNSVYAARIRWAKPNAVWDKH